jgi:hypothetical protein
MQKTKIKCSPRIQKDKVRVKMSIKKQCDPRLTSITYSLPYLLKKKKTTINGMEATIKSIREELFQTKGTRISISKGLSSSQSNLKDTQIMLREF